MYDLIIIGSGPAGLTASIYASCYHLTHLVIGEKLGGQLTLAPDILNYPGFENIAGKELTDRMVKQVKLRGGELVTQSVTRITQSINNPINTNDQIKQISDKDTSDGGKTTILTTPRWRDQDKVFEIETQSGNKYQAKVVILATGTERRKLNVPGEVEYTSKGVHYCATCEKLDYAGKVCAVVGGANSAVQAAVELSQAAAKVYIIYRGSQLRGDAVWMEQVEKHPNIEVIYNTVVSEIVGDGEKVTYVILNTFDKLSVNSVKNPVGNSENAEDPSATPQDDKKLPLDKIFIEIGGVPGTALVIPLGVAMDPGGFILTDQKLATNMPGVFAAGDLVTFGYNLEQISSAVGLGARAAASAFAYLKGDKAPTVWGGSQIKR